MKEPQRIPLTDNPRTKTVKSIPLTPNQISENINHWNNEDYHENNSESIQQLESYETD